MRKEEEILDRLQVLETMQGELAGRTRLGEVRGMAQNRCFARHVGLSIDGQRPANQSSQLD